MANAKKTAVKKSFPERLNEIMELRGLSNAALARTAYINMNTVAAYRRGERLPGTDVLILLAKALEVSTDYLCGLTEDNSKAYACEDAGFCPFTRDKCVGVKCALWKVTRLFDEEREGCGLVKP